MARAIVIRPGEDAIKCYKRMTNGEKIVNVFKCEVYEPIVEDNIVHVAFDDKSDSLIGFDLDWWNSEYPYKDLVVNVKLASTCEDCITNKIRNIIKKRRWKDGAK